MALPPEIEQLISSMREAITKAYNDGYTSGAIDARERILQAVSLTPSADHRTTKPSPANDSAPEITEPPRETSRVEHGAVRRAVQQAMAPNSGFTIAQITRRVSEIDARITSAASVSNELTRNEGKLYERRKNLWFKRNAEGLADEARPSKTNGAAGLHPA